MFNIITFIKLHATYYISVNACARGTNYCPKLYRINGVGKSYRDTLHHALSIFTSPNTRASTMGRGTAVILYRSEQYGIRRADTGVPAAGYCVIIINAYITAQQSDRLIGAADDDFDLIRARRARHYALHHNGEPGACASAENNKRYCAECDVI